MFSWQTRRQDPPKQVVPKPSPVLACMPDKETKMLVAPEAAKVSTEIVEHAKDARLTLSAFDGAHQWCQLILRCVARLPGALAECASFGATTGGNLSSECCTLKLLSETACEPVPENTWTGVDNGDGTENSPGQNDRRRMQRSSGGTTRPCSASRQFSFQILLAIALFRGLWRTLRALMRHTSNSTCTFSRNSAVSGKGFRLRD